MNHKSLRIAMLSVHSCPLGNPGTRDTGGMSIYVREVAREMGRLGIGVDVFTRVHGGCDGEIMEAGENVRLIHLRAGSESRIHKLALYPHLTEFAFNVEKFRSLNDVSYDLLFSHYWLSGRVGEYLASLWNVPHALMFHTLGAAKNAIGIGEGEPPLRLRSEKRLARNCSLIIAATAREKDDLVRYYGTSPHKISIVPCGVNTELFRPMERKAARRRVDLGFGKIVLFAGRIEPLKGLDRLLRAFAYLQNGWNPGLVIIGGDEYSRDEVERLINLSRELNISGSVVFRGMVKHQELPCYYNAADVCVIPSYYETFGLVGLESIACGTPVVATDVGGASSFVVNGATGYAVESNDPGLLAEKICLLLSAGPGKNVRLFQTSIRDFSWANIARRVLSSFGSMPESRPASELVRRQVWL